MIDPGLSLAGVKEARLGAHSCMFRLRFTEIIPYEIIEIQFPGILRSSGDFGA